MKKLIKRIISIYIIVMIISVGAVICTHADEEMITYSLEYTDNTAKLTLYITKISSFDIGIAYDPEKLTVTDASFTTEFKKLQVGGENMTISVMNDDAADDSGNTYAVFTGAGTNQTTGSDIEFSGQPLATISFEGDLENSVITLVTNSASVSDIYTAEKIAEISLSQSQGVTVTPEPLDGVVYVTPAPKSSSSTNNAQTDSTVTTDETVDNSSSDGIETSDSSDEDIIEPSVNVVEDETDSNSSVSEVDEHEEGQEKSVDKDSKEVESEKTNKTVIIFIVIAVILMAAIAVAFVVIKKKKSTVK